MASRAEHDRAYRRRHRERLNYESRVRWHSYTPAQRRAMRPELTTAQRREKYERAAERRFRWAARRKARHNACELRALAMRTLEDWNYIVCSPGTRRFREFWPPDDEAQRWLDRHTKDTAARRCPNNSGHRPRNGVQGHNR